MRPSHCRKLWSAGKTARMCIPHLTDPCVSEIAATVADAAHRAGKVFGTIGIGLEDTRAMQDLGCGLLGMGVDQGMLQSGMEQLLAEFSRIG